MAGYGAYDFSAIGRRRSPLLVVIGGDAEPTKSSTGFRHRGNSDIYKLIPESFAFEQLNLNKRFSKRQGWPDLSGFECILNLVTDADQHPQTLARLGKMLRGAKGRVLNRTEAVLRSTRDQVAKRLDGIDGMRVPKVLRLRNPKPGAASAAAQHAALAFPMIVRLAGTHTGKIVGIVNVPEELDAAAAGPGEFIVTEFVDFRSEDGLYRKYRVFFIGRHRIFRHLIGADEWKINAAQRFAFMAHQPGLIEEEQRILHDTAGAFPPGVTAALDAVRERIGLDFFGMDFGIAADAQAVLFEANATMNFFPVVNRPPFAHIESVIRPSRQALFELLGLASLQDTPRSADKPSIAAAT